MLVLSNVSNLTFPLKMYGVFLPVWAGLTFLSFLKHKTLRLLLFCLSMPFLVWNEKLVTSSHGRQLFRKLNCRHCSFLMHSPSLARKACGSLYEKQLSAEFSIMSVTSFMFKTFYLTFILFALLTYLKVVTLISIRLSTPFDMMLINICRCFTIGKT